MRTPLSVTKAFHCDEKLEERLHRLTANIGDAPSAIMRDALDLYLTCWDDESGKFCFDNDNLPRRIPARP